MVGSNVRRLRESKEMLQIDLARMAGCKPCYISLIESGRREVSMKMLNSLADALGVPASVLLENSTETVEEADEAV